MVLKIPNFHKANDMKFNKQLLCKIKSKTLRKIWSKAVVGTLWPMDQISAAAYLCMHPKLRIFFSLKWLGKKLKDDLVTCTNVCDTNFHVLLIVLLEHSLPHLFTYCLWLLSCYKGRVKSLEQTIWSAKPNIFFI